MKKLQPRPSPTDSATWYKEGTVMRGNDGNLWEVKKNSAGVQRWVRSNATTSHSTPNHASITNSSKNITYKFEVGDIVKVVKQGLGAVELDSIVTIVEKGIYADAPGYRVDPAIGNSKTMDFGGYIDERSFELVVDAQTIKVNTTPKPISMSKPKMITKKVTQDQRTIETSLINKEEVFKMLALAEATGLPCLLVGQPGVGKTKTILEYAKAWLNKDGKMSAQDFASKIYILETDEGTKASEIKGMPDLSVLFTENKYELNTPITEAEIIVINEVDKASSAIRNAMLGVMNEKFLFNGKHKIPCKWKLFIATCNEIPKDEVKSPFWDRFMLKMTVGRVSQGELAKYFNKGARDYKEKLLISVPNKEEINSVSIPVGKLEKYLEVGYTNSTDRTLTYVPMLTKAVSFIWDIGVDRALVKTAEIMIGAKAGTELQSKLINNEMKTVMNKIDMLHSYKTNDELEIAMAEIESLINTFTSRGAIDEIQVTDIENTIQHILSAHPARKDYVSGEMLEQIADVEPAF